ncbi:MULTISPECIES: DUF5794 domain-containing protein [Salinibaculum]|uniref:DUF5794 domain-containing protein n=1 Tax=Salinibaculum TaxID=2732368 RepID=UPI0030D2F848
MSSSRHPIALSIERKVGDATKLLAIVMCLPLVDGLFPALVLAGALDSITGIVQVGLLVFGGSATVAVIIAEMDDSPRSQARIVLGVGAVVTSVAVVEAALAPTIAGVLNLVIFERFAGLVILAVAARTASARIGEYLPRPAVIVALGFVASVDPAGAALVVDARPELMLRAAAAAGIGVTFALVVALVSPWLRNAVHLDRFRFGSAVALGVLPLSVFGVIPANAPLALAVLVMTAVFAFEPGRARERDWEYEPDDIDITAALSNDTSPSSRPVEERVDGSDGGDYDDEQLPWL